MGTFSFGKANEILKLTNIIFSLEAMVFGGLLIMSVYHFGLYIIRTQDREHSILWYVLFEFALRTIFSRTKNFIYTFLPPI